MTEKEQSNESRPRRPYRKPELILVPLRPEEAVLGHCKQTGSGPGVSNCSSPTPCPSVGS